jgi:hypothetical protein
MRHVIWRRMSTFGAFEWRVRSGSGLGSLSEWGGRSSEVGGSSSARFCRNGSEAAASLGSDWTMMPID